MTKPVHLPLQPRWKTSALKRAREGALDYARRQRDRIARQPKEGESLFQETHEGVAHWQFFHDQFPQIIRDLPPNFSAVEVGCGMGWHAALLAAHGAGNVLATEFKWGRETPFGIGNVFAFYRMGERDPALKSLLEFERDEEQNLTALRFKGSIQFARASAIELPVASESQDFVYTVNCEEHLPSLRLCHAETARILKPGGISFTSTEPLYYSPWGHHLQSLFPLPWGHLLWEEHELADIFMEEAGEGHKWEFEPLRRNHLLEGVFKTLNGATPEMIRDSILPGPWRVQGWLEIPAGREFLQLARDIGLRSALPDVSPEALFTFGLRFRLQKTTGWRGLRTALHLPSHWRRWRDYSV